MWLRKCTGVFASHLPVPSMSMDTDTLVSFVMRSMYPLRTAARPFIETVRRLSSYAPTGARVRTKLASDHF